MNQPTRFSMSLCLILITYTIAQAQRPELVVQTGHANWVFSVIFSPDGKTLASASSDGTVKLWEVATGTELRTLKGTSQQNLSLMGGVASIAFSPDGKTLAGGAENIIWLWDVATGAVVRKFEGHTPKVSSLAFSPDGTTLASATGVIGVKLWEVATGAERRTLRGYNKVAFSPDGKTLATECPRFECSDTALKLWDVATGAERWKTKSLDLLAFGPDGKFLASLGEQNTIKLRDVVTGAQVRTLQGHGSTAVAFSPDGKILASGDRGNTIKLWNPATDTPLRSLTGHANRVIAVAFSPDGKTLASGSYDHTIKLWNIATGAVLQTLQGEVRPISAVAFSPEGKTLACGSYDHTVKLWDVATGAELRNLKGHSEPITAVAFSPDGKLLASGSQDFSIKLWNLATGAELRTFRTSSRVTLVEINPDGKTLTGVDDENVMRVWNLSTGEQLQAVRGKNYLSSVAISPDEQTLAFGSGAAIKLWDVAKDVERRNLTGHAASVSAVAFSPDGKTLASASYDHTVKLWDVVTGAELRTCKGHSSSVRSVTFSPNGKYVVSGSDDTTIKLWEIGSGREIASLVALDVQDWLVITPDGLFDGSPSAWGKILWRFGNNTFNYAPVEAFFSDFYYPGLLPDLLADKRPQAPSDLAQKDRRQARLQLTLADGLSGTARNVTVQISVSQAPAGAQDVRLFRNGSLVKVWRGDVLKGQPSATLRATIPLRVGENRLTAYAFNRDNIKTGDATLVVKGASILQRQATAYLLAIGVNRYSNVQYNLRYATADAQAFGAELKQQFEALKQYGQVEVILLSDWEATKANILQRLAQLSQQVQPEDTVIMYFAGHGTAQQNRYYLLPHDLGYDGPRAKLDEASLRNILAHSISDRELEQAFEKIDAGHLVLVIDACNSGQALEAEEKRRGPMNAKGLAQLAYEKGMYVLTAAQSYQAALEAAQLGHGYLTYALVVEGLSKAAADRSPKDGVVWAREWLDYATERVPQMQFEKLQQLRALGKDFSFVESGERGLIGIREAQRPRGFYRRELEPISLIIARMLIPPPR